MATSRRKTIQEISTDRFRDVADGARAGLNVDNLEVMTTENLIPDGIKIPKTDGRWSDTPSTERKVASEPEQIEKSDECSDSPLAAGHIIVGNSFRADSLHARDDKQNPRDHILDKAKATINGAREEEYGDKKRNFQNIADLWSPIFGVKVTREMVAMAMNQVKIARLINSPGHEDSWVDAIGYMAIGYEVKEVDEDVTNS